MQKYLLILLVLIFSSNIYAIDKQLEDSLLLGNWEYIYSTLSDSEKVLNDPVLLNLKYRSSLATNNRFQFWYDAIEQDKKNDSLWLDWTLSLKSEFPNNAIAYYLAGIACIKNNQLKQAEQNLHTSLKINSKHTLTYTAIAFLELQKENYFQSSTYLDKASELDSNLLLIYELRYLLYQAENKIDKSEKELLKYLKADKTNPQIYFYLSTLYFQQNYYGLAKSNLKDAIKLDPENEYYYSLLGKIEYNQGNIKSALSNYHKSLLINPELSISYIYIGDVYEFLVKYDSALYYFDKAILLDPVLSALPYNSRGWIYEQKEKFDLAELNYKKAIEVDPLFYTSYYNIAEMYYDLHRYEDALYYYKDCYNKFSTFMDLGSQSLLYEKIKSIEKKLSE